MTAYVEQQHMANGRWQVSCNWDEEVHAELVDPVTRKLRKWLHALVYDADDNLICPPLVLLTKEADETGIVLGGAGLIWWEGSGEVGPLIVDRKYPSGRTRLSNGGFELVELHWRWAEDTLWIPASGAGARTGGFYVFHANPPPQDEMVDDILQSDEPVTDCLPGELWAAQVYVKAGTTFGGRIRVRTVYEGRFKTTDLSEPYADWPASVTGDIEDDTDPLAVIAGDVLRVHSAAGNLVPNPSFETGDLTSWLAGAGTWSVLSTDPPFQAGTYYVGTDTSGGAPGYKWLQSSASGSLPVVAYSVAEGEEYQIDLAVRCSPTFGAADGEAWLNLGYIDGAFAVVAREDSEHLSATTDSGTGWRVLTMHVSIPEGIVGLVPTLVVENHTTATQWDFDTLTIRRTRGNIDTRTGPAIAVVPRRSYTWSLPFRTDLGTTGTVQMRLVCSAVDRPDIILQGPTLQDTEGAKQIVEWSFQTPSGYDLVQQQLYSADVGPESFYVGEGTLTDDDNTTRVRDGLGPSAAGAATYTAVVSYGAVPEGAERLRVELVAETLAGEWAVDDVTLIHVDVTPATAAGVVASLLVDPDTAAALPVIAGTIVGPEDIAGDWHIYNLHNREALDHFSRVIADPPREWRVNTDRTLDWDTAANLFVDHLPDTDDEIILLSRDIDVEDTPSVSEDTTDRPTRIRLIGAERESTSGARTLVAASADVAGTEEDWNGNPANRTLLVEDSTVEALDHAQAFVADEAAALADPEQTINVTLTGVNTRPSFAVGDWLYLYDPESGLVDPTAAEAMVEGETVRPVRKRVLGLTRRLGPSHRIEIRRLDGSTFDLPGVLWEDEDATSLELGERRPEFVGDSQMGDLGRAYLRFRASSPR